MDGFTPNTPADCPECGGSGKVEVLGDYLPGSDRTPYDDATDGVCDACFGQGERGREFTNEHLEWLSGRTGRVGLRVAEALAPYVCDLAAAEEALKSEANRHDAIAGHNITSDALAVAVLAIRRARRRPAIDMAGASPELIAMMMHVSDRVRVALAAMEARAQFLEDADAVEYEREIASIRHCLTAFRDALGVSK